MLQIKRLLQLLERGISERSIAHQLCVSRNTVGYYKKQFQLSGRSYPQLLLLADYELARIIYKERSGSGKDARYERLAPLLNDYINELKRRGVILNIIKKGIL